MAGDVRAPPRAARGAGRAARHAAIQHTDRARRAWRVARGTRRAGVCEIALARACLQVSAPAAPAAPRASGRPVRRQALQAVGGPDPVCAVRLVSRRRAARAAREVKEARARPPTRRSAPRSRAPRARACRFSAARAPAPRGPDALAAARSCRAPCPCPDDALAPVLRFSTGAVLRALSRAPTHAGGERGLT